MNRVFENIPERIRDRMTHLEFADRQDREDGTPRPERLRQIPREVGEFLAILAAGAPRGTWLEIGTSAGYSTLWLALACREAGTKLVTFESLQPKAGIARGPFDAAGVQDVVELIVGDAREQLGNHGGIGFCFLDAEKEHYLDCYEAVVPNLLPGGLLVADNVISHREELEPFVARALDDSRVDACVVPIGRGELVCRRTDRRRGEPQA